MDTADQTVFDRWYNRLVVRKARQEAEDLGSDLVKDALYEAFEQGHNRGYAVALKEAQTNRD